MQSSSALQRVILIRQKALIQHHVNDLVYWWLKELILLLEGILPLQNDKIDLC